MNHVTLFGYTGKDVELRNLPNGGQVAQFSMSTDESYFDKKTNTRIKKSEWHSCVQFGKGAETTAKYVPKGSQILVEGKLQTREWQDKQTGAKRQRTDVVVMRVEFGRLKEATAGQQGEPYPQAAGRSAQSQAPRQDDEPYPTDDPF
jgi:single-strand DNA-binding protein